MQPPLFFCLCAEIDSVAVAEFPLHLRRHSIVVGAGGSTLKRISADNDVRIMVPENSQQGWDGSNLDKNTIQVQYCG